MIEPVHAAILGVVEGLTEFLPVSSTGHLILASHFLQLQGEAVKTFEVVIQAGALGAVLAVYRTYVAAMWRGILKRDAEGWSLVLKLVVSFVPAAVAGALLHRTIKAHLFTTWPVVAALALGGVVMIRMDRRLRQRTPPSKSIASLTASEALMIGIVQCLALWPGTSRAMVTILAGLCCGLSATEAATYGFLLALPTLGAATIFDLVSGGQELMRQTRIVSLGCGFLTAAVVAAVAMRGFIQYLSHRGLAPFGWYRLALAAAVWWIMTARGV